MKPSNCVFEKLGLVDYGKALQFQEYSADSNRKLGLDWLLLLEHPAVITIGMHGKAENIIADAQLLREKCVSVYKTERGGDVTYHCPGQLIGYPLIDLKRKGIGVRQYVHSLEESLITLLNDYSIKAERKDKTAGLWVNDAKIASIGIRVKNSISMHGFALYVNPEMDGFSYINPCGVKGMKITSMEKELSQNISLEEVSRAYARHFSKAFNCRMV